MRHWNSQFGSQLLAGQFVGYGMTLASGKDGVQVPGLRMHRMNSMDIITANWMFILILVLFIGMHLVKFSSGEPKGRKAGLRTEQPRLAPSANPRGPSRRRLKLRLGPAADWLHLGIITKGDAG
jgi:hypothetical protein